jgi:hypothetical protein
MASCICPRIRNPTQQIQIILLTLNSLLGNHLATEFQNPLSPKILTKYQG